MSVIANKKHPSPNLKDELGLDFLGGPEDLDLIIKESDFLVLSLMSGKDTKSMFSDREFSMMKRNAFFINIARGDLVDEAALGRALEEGRIAGAGLDVYQGDRDGTVNYNHVIFKVSNTVLTPHVGGGHMAANTPEFRARVEFDINNVMAALKGEEPKHVVGSVHRLPKAVL
jgi:lactate dehydrogenase-like 2-hydroxyacid dehydrogenase